MILILIIILERFNLISSCFDFTWTQCHLFTLLVYDPNITEWSITQVWKLSLRIFSRLRQTEAADTAFSASLFHFHQLSRDTWPNIATWTAQRYVVQETRGTQAIKLALRLRRSDSTRIPMIKVNLSTNQAYRRSITLLLQHLSMEAN